MRALALAILLLSLMAQAAGDPARAAELRECFSSYSRIFFTNVFKDGGVYRPDNCSENVVRLMNRLEAVSDTFDVTKAKVLYVYRRDSVILGEDARPGPTRWTLHVVLEYKDRIYDLDHGDSPQDVSRKSYFDKMFLGERSPDDQLDMMRIREIPATEYRRNFNKMVDGRMRGFDYYLHDADTAYPSVSLRQYLRP